MEGAASEGYFQAPEPQGAAASGQVILRDGSTATLRPAGADDHALLCDFLTRIERESYHRRFFAETPVEVAAARMLSPEPLESKLVLFVLTGGPAQPRLIATGEYVREPTSEVAEVAFLVDDGVHGKGLGTLILERLALVAARYGVTRFSALTMARNRAMISMFQSSGFAVNRRLESGEVELDFSILPSRESVERMELRERAATVASLYPFFRPRMVAVFGLSISPRSASQRLLAHLKAGGFAGTCALVNPNLAGAYASLEALPERPELAILALPQRAVLAAVDACGRAGVRAVVVISAGFAESGSVGEALQAELTQRVRAYGMRLVGPNSLGLVNLAADVRLNVSLAPATPQPGHVAVSSQSGALALAIMEHAAAAGLGLGSVVSLGNKADVSSNDLLQYWEDDPETRLIVLYLASFGNPRRFARLARRVGRQKPILVVKAGESELSERATDALFRQTGVVRAATFEELFDVANLLAQQPLPPGPRVGVLTNASGPAALAATALQGQGLTLPRAVVDLSAFADAESYRGALQAALADEQFDALLVVFAPVGLSRADEVGRVVGAAVREARAAGNVKPVLGCFTGAHDPLFAGDERLPSYRFPESAARALARAYSYAHWRREPLGHAPIFEGLQIGRARRLCRQKQAAGGGWLSAAEVTKLLGAFGLPVLPGRSAADADAAVSAAAEFGYPVVLKPASDPGRAPRVGAQLELRGAAEVRRAYARLRRADAELDLETGAETAGETGPETGIETGREVWVQPLAPPGTHLTVGTQLDPLFGPIVSFGLGGLYSDVIHDKVYRITPMTERDAAEMVRSIKGFPLLGGYQGHPASDLEAVQEILLRTSRLVDELPEVGWLELNLRAFEPGAGAVVLGARVRVAASEASDA